MKTKKDEKPEEPETLKRDPTRSPAPLSLLLRAAEVHLRAITETPLLHGLPLYNEAEDLLAEVRAAREAHNL